MKGNTSVGGRPRAGFDCRNYVGRLSLTGQDDFEAFLLAAVARALFGSPDEAKPLRRALIAEAKRCEKDHHRLLAKS